MVDSEFRILAVCIGNVNRSALAEVLLRAWAGWYSHGQVAAGISVESAGLGAPEGERMREPVQLIASALGADGTDHRARQITDTAVRDADLILTASRRQRDTVLQRVPSALRRTFTIREAGRIAQRLGPRPAPATTSELRSAVKELAANRAAPAEIAGADDPDDIIDPEGRELSAFYRMTREEVPPLAHIAAMLLGMPKANLDAYVTAAEHPELLI